MDSARRSFWICFLALGWLVLGLFWFLQQQLPQLNLTRLQFASLFPEIFSSYFGENSLSMDAQFLERVPFWFWAAFIWSGAWCWGRIAVRCMNLSLKPLEQNLAAVGLGLCGVTTFTLVTGLLGIASQASGILLLLIPLVGELFVLIRKRDQTKNGLERERLFTSHTGLICLLIPFLGVMLWNCTLPPTDFDVREYHLQGPKEYYQQGQIRFLPHNVYTSFPFLTEMVSYLGMTLRQDWYLGALTGKATLMLFLPLTAGCLWAIANRLFGIRSAWLVALLFLSSPWALRLGTTAYAEGGMLFFIALAFLFILIVFQEKTPQENSLWFLTGAFSGAALACKYPGLIWSLVPSCLCLLYYLKYSRPDSRTHGGIKIVGWYLLGVVLTAGPWLLKNLIQTGNPVYPLAYHVFGGRDWSEELNKSWSLAHQTPDYDLIKIPERLLNELALSPWQTPLLMLFVPFAFCNKQLRQHAWILLAWFVYLFLAWWLFTHRIDRFWLPCLLPLSLLAAAGIGWNDSQLWFRGSRLILIFGLSYNLIMAVSVFCTPIPVGLNQEAAKRESNQSAHAIAALNQVLPEQSKILLVGDAQVFGAEFDHLYRTTFDESILLKLIMESESKSKTQQKKLKEPNDIRAAMQKQGLTHLCVNWSEIARYRFTYGFEEEVVPELFQELLEQGLLNPPVSLRELAPEEVAPLYRQQLEEWGTSLLPSQTGKEKIPVIQLYEIRPVSE